MHTSNACHVKREIQNPWTQHLHGPEVQLPRKVPHITSESEGAILGGQRLTVTLHFQGQMPKSTCPCHQLCPGWEPEKCYIDPMPPTVHKRACSRYIDPMPATRSLQQQAIFAILCFPV
eukprot:1157111-Pelagomonas_calceolata.AAC.15